jgi:muramoyltetrapeptide carboxypeptidase
MTASMGSKTIKPRRLSRGDAIGVVAPAGSFEIEALKMSIEAIAKIGFELVAPDNLQQPDKYLRAPDEHRALQRQNLLGAPGIKAIICAEGGYGSIRILECIH